MHPYQQKPAMVKNPLHLLWRHMTEVGYLVLDRLVNGLL